MGKSRSEATARFAWEGDHDSGHTAPFPSVRRPAWFDNRRRGGRRSGLPGRDDRRFRNGRAADHHDAVIQSLITRARVVLEKRVNRIGPSCCMALLLAGTDTGYAQSPETELAPVVVTASRLAQTVDDTLASVSVITREDIAASSAKDLPSLLTGTPGVDANFTGGYGKAAGLFLRGTNHGHTLVLVNGVRLTSATLGVTSLELFPLGQIERIEIVRGPRAVLWGSGAVGGVIHIITRDDVTEDGTAGEWALSTGTHNHWDLTATMRARDAATAIHAGVQLQRTEGINATVAGNPDRDGYGNGSVRFGVQHDYSATLRVALEALRAEGVADFDNTFVLGNADEIRFTQQAVVLNTDWEVNDALSLKATVGETLDESLTLVNKALGSRFNTRRHEATLQADYAFNDAQMVTLGAAHAADQVISTVNFTDDRRSDDAWFAQWQGEFGRYAWLLGVRRTEDEQFGAKTTYQAEAGAHVAKHLRLTAAYGTAFKAPTFNDLFFPNFGNPNLDPETSRSFELGLTGKLAQGRWTLHAYHTDIDGLIQFVNVGGSFTPINVNKARIRGLEASVTQTLAGWRTRIGFSVVNPASRETGRILRRRAKRTLNIGAGKDFGRIHTAFDLSYQSRRFEDAANTIVLGDRLLLDTKLGYRSAPRLTWEATVKNLLNDKEPTAQGFNALGRTLFLGVRYRFG